MTVASPGPKTHGVRAACRHCGRVRHLEARRLCRRCFDDRSIRHTYPAANTGGQRPRGTPEWTDAELDALIEAGAFDMPATRLDQPPNRKPPGKRYTTAPEEGAATPARVPFDPAGGRVKWVWKGRKRYRKVLVPETDPAWTAVRDAVTDLWVSGVWAFPRARRADREARRREKAGEKAPTPGAFVKGVSP